MLVGMTAAGWFSIRAILVWGTGNPAHEFGVDIPLAAAGLAAWAIATALLLLPPPSVLARLGGPFSGPVLVWPLGRRLRAWNALAVPVCGLLAAMIVGLIPAMMSWDLTDPLTLGLGIPLSLGLITCSLALVWMALRTFWLGVELNPTHLIARGYLRTQRFPRESIISVNAADLSGQQDLLLSALLNVGSVAHALQLSLDDGSERVLFASNSWRRDVRNGADIIRSWRTHVT
jgi:hypothetical protein